MAKVNFGGDPENYMDPPQMSVSDSSGGISPIAAIFEFLGIHRNVARSPKDKKSKGVETQGVLVKDASEFLDVTGSALAAQDLANTRPLSEIALPPSNFVR